MAYLHAHLEAPGDLAEGGSRPGTRGTSLRRSRFRKVLRRGQTSDKEGKFIKGPAVKCACDLSCYPT